MHRVLGILNLRRAIKHLSPDIIIGHGYSSCVDLCLATLFTNIPYVAHIPETIFRSDKSIEKYALIHKKVFNEIRGATIGGKNFIPPNPPSGLRLSRRVLAELYALSIYAGVRKARVVFVHSNQMKWEVNRLYKKEAIVFKGAFPSEIVNYKSKVNIKEKLGIENKKLILNVNRLDPRKRVDFLIKAFKQICDEVDDVVLVIGGIGPEEKKLKNLTKELNIEDMVKFMGYIKGDELWDFYACCDVFTHPNWADFAIAPYEALALQKKVVWSTEMEQDENIVMNKHIFVANPTVDDFAAAIKRALNTEVAENYDLSEYSWDAYFSKIWTICEEIVRDGIKIKDNEDFKNRLNWFLK